VLSNNKNKKNLIMKLPLNITQATVVLFLLAMGACSSMPGTLTGNDLSHLSLRDKRMADKTVKVLVEPPQQVAVVLGKVESKRCQNTVFSDAPDEKTLLVDMKAEAYRLGANAISDVTIKDDGAMGNGCWKLFTATANMLVIE
jgi:hypothetical protein